MRSVLSILAVAGLVGATVLAQAPASGKTTSSWKCAAPSPSQALPVGDVPNHAYVIEQIKCTATKGEIAGVKEVEGTATEFGEANGNTMKGHGVFVESLAGGDKLFLNYDFTGTSSNNVFQSGENKWTIRGGTGKFQGAKGSGSCKGKGNPDGSANFECTGTYTLAK